MNKHDQAVERALQSKPFVLTQIRFGWAIADRGGVPMARFRGPGALARAGNRLARMGAENEAGSGDPAVDWEATC